MTGTPRRADGSADPYAAKATPTSGVRSESDEVIEGGIGLDRLIFFSDAVFAIAITLLVLDIRVPEIPDGLEATELPGRVAALFPNIISYFISFMIIAIFWINHHRTFSYIKRYDRRLLWLNLYFLLFIAFVPFPAALLGRYGNTFFAFAFYAIIQAAVSLLLTLVWVHATREHRLVDPDLDIGTIRHRFYGGLVPPLVFAISIAIAHFIPYGGFAIWFLLGASRRLADRIGDRTNAFNRAVDWAVFRLRD